MPNLNCNCKNNLSCNHVTYDYSTISHSTLFEYNYNLCVIQSDIRCDIMDILYPIDFESDDYDKQREFRETCYKNSKQFLASYRIPKTELRTKYWVIDNVNYMIKHKIFQKIK